VAAKGEEKNLGLEVAERGNSKNSQIDPLRPANRPIVSKKRDGKEAKDRGQRYRARNSDGEARWNAKGRLNIKYRGVDQANKVLISALNNKRGLEEPWRVHVTK